MCVIHPVMSLLLSSQTTFKKREQSYKEPAAFPRLNHVSNIEPTSGGLVGATSTELIHAATRRGASTIIG